VVALLGVASLLAYLLEGGLSERLRLNWPLANQWDFAISASMPGAAVFRAAVAWIPRTLPAFLPGAGGSASAYLMADYGFVAVTALLFAMYAMALRWVARHPAPPTASRRLTLVIAGAAALFGALLLFTPAAPSHDALAYATAGRLLATYHANPFFVVPSAYPSDPVLAANEWPISTTAYGPLWALLSLLLSSLVGNDPLRANLVYRAVALGANLANIVLIAGLLGRLPARQQAWRARGLLLYAWNPLVLLEVATGHNDVVMLSFLLLGLYLRARGHGAWGLVSLGAAILLKVSAAPLVLLILLAGWLAARPGGWRDQVRALAPAALVVGVVVAGYLPFYWGHTPAQIAATARLQPPTQQLDRALINSFTTLARSGLVQGLPAPLNTRVAALALALSNPTLWTLVLGVILLATTFWLLPRLARTDTLAPAMAWLYAVWMIFLAFFLLMRAWYLIPLVGLVSLAPAARPLRRFALTLTATLQLNALFLSRSPPFGGPPPWAILLILGIPLVVLVVELRRTEVDWRATAQQGVALLRERLRWAAPAPAP
jgi:hypothetical protein